MGNQVTNILLTGVGGQGTILASDILSQALMEAGRDVKKSEVHGMAQRGGSVSTHVRFGDKVFSPLIREGETDFLLAYEELEAMRYLHYLRPDTLIILSKHQVKPPSVALGAESYPAEIPRRLQEHFRVQLIDAQGLARQAGEARAASVVLLGVLANYLNIPDPAWRQAFSANLPERLQEKNLKAFNAGREQGKI